MMHYETHSLHGKTVDRFNQEKLYIQLTRLLIGEVTAGHWRLNERIPSEDDLCRQYHVSKITVRQAIANLVSDGYLEKIQGKGTFLRSVQPIVGLMMRTRFTEEMFGREAAVEKELLFRGIQEPPADVRGYLETEGDLFLIRCRRLVDGEAAALDESFIPCSILPEVDAVDLTRTSLYFLLQERGTRKIFKLVQTLEIAEASAEEAGLLDLSEGISLLVVHRLFKSSDESPVAYTRLLGRTDRYKFETEFERIR